MRARNLKPSFFKNEHITECSPWAQLLLQGLWCMADRDGRLEERPKKIKGEVFPHAMPGFYGFPESVTTLLSELDERGLILRYEVDGSKYIQIPTFTKHARPHRDERSEGFPEPPRKFPGAPGNPPATCAERGMMNDESPLLKPVGEVAVERVGGEPIFRSNLPADNVELVPVAEKIEAHYRKAVGSSNSNYAKTAIIGAIQAVLTEKLGEPGELLCRCADGYAAECERNNRGPPKRSSAKTFFTEQWRVFVAYKPQTEDVDSIKREAQKRRLEFNGNDAATGHRDGKISA